MMKALRTSETSVNIYVNIYWNVCQFYGTRLNVQEYGNLYDKGVWEQGA
jgi:hypothetical protein